MSFLPQVKFNTDLTQLLYAIVVIIVIPAALTFNTLYILKSFHRDLDYELNNKALLVESVIAHSLRDKIDTPEVVQSEIKKIVSDLPQIKAVEIFKLDHDNIQPLTSTSDSTKNVADPVLNQLAWSGDQVYSKQIVAAVGTGNSERLWLVASTVKDDSGKKIGIINLYLSADDIDKISNRTTRDSLFILVITMVAILLLLINHFRFFEISILFKKLSELDRLKDDFISMASHELKTPLVTISGYSYLLKQNKAVIQDPESNKGANVIYISAKRLGELIDDILDVSRLEQGRMEFKPQVINLKTLIDELIVMIKPQADMKKLKFTYKPPSEEVLINADPSKVKQVFSNLISNAIKYTLSGEVNIYHIIEGNTVKTCIKDTGVGISEESRKKLFGKFNRIYNTKTKDVSGTGLGLWITKQLVEKMGGKIIAESIENHGSLFSVSFNIKK